jgi:L-serine dehydratase
MLDPSALSTRLDDPEFRSQLQDLQEERPTSFKSIHFVAEEHELTPPEIGLLLDVVELRRREGPALSVTSVHERMRNRFSVMAGSVDRGYEVEHELNVIDGDWAPKFEGIDSECGAAGLAFEKAIGVQENTAGFNPTAAAPTCGASGAVPGTVLGMGEHFGFSLEEMLESLWGGGLVGRVGFGRGPISGAQAGCGGEVGVAAGMSAAAAASLLDGGWTEVNAAASLNMLSWTGVDCSPTGGNVEYPCAPRNGFAAAGAVLAAELASAGICPPYDVDYTFDVIYAVGERLPVHLRETENGDWAQTARERLYAEE